MLYHCGEDRAGVNKSDSNWRFICSFFQTAEDISRINKNDFTPNRGLDTAIDSINPTNVPVDTSGGANGNDNVLIMNTKNEDRQTSFFAQPGILAGKQSFCCAFCLAIHRIT